MLGRTSYLLTDEVILEGRLDIPIKRHGEDNDENGEHDPHCSSKDDVRKTTAAG